MNIIAKLKAWFDSIHASNPGNAVHALMTEAVDEFEKVVGELRARIVALETECGIIHEPSAPAAPAPEVQSPAASASAPSSPDILQAGAPDAPAAAPPAEGAQSPAT